MSNKLSKSTAKTLRPSKNQLPKIKSNKNFNHLIFSEDQINKKCHYEFLEANQNLIKNIKKSLK